MAGGNYERTPKGDPVTAAAAAAAGWGTALKPGYEPIVLARKPLAGTVAANFIEHGTGALNISGCRIPLVDRATYEHNHSGDRGHAGTRSIENRGNTDLRPGGGSASDARWPANVLLDDQAAKLIDSQSGEECAPARGVDIGGASRFYYCAKVDGAERHAGLAVPTLLAPDAPEANTHPTVKPIDLMRWLCRLVTPPGGLIVDPFLGSGTTGIAAAFEGFGFIGIEREPDYMRIAESRIAYWSVTPLVEAAS